MSVFVVGSGGFGGPRTSPAAIAAADKMPERAPDVSKEFKTSVDQVTVEFDAFDYFVRFAEAMNI
jgi:hypothetical protein